MKHKLLLPATLFTVAVILSCNNNRTASPLKDTAANTNKIALLETDPGNRKEDQQKIPLPQSLPASPDSAPVSKNLSAKSNIDWDKKIIKTATLNLEVKDFSKCSQAVHAAVKQFGAYIAQEEQNLSEEKTATAISIKVAVDQFEPMMNQLCGPDVKVLERKINAEDVTGEVIDVKSRLEAKKQLRLKYLDFLKQSKNMAEALQVQSEINTIQEGMEAAAGRIDYLTHQSAMSTINLSFYQPVNGYEPVTGTPSFFTRVADSFSFGAKWIIDLIVALMGLWPLFIIGGAYIFVYRKRYPAKKRSA